MYFSHKKWQTKPLLTWLAGFMQLLLVRVH